MNPSKRIGIVSVLALLLALPFGAQAEQRIGAGLHYWRTVDKIDKDFADDFDRDGLSYHITYQGVILPLLKFQADLEIFPKDFAGSDKLVYAPQVLGIVGGWIYAGVGIGILYADSSFADKPFYLFRAGLDLPILPSVRLDLHGNYVFSEWKGLSDNAKDVESDTITLGASVRLVF